MRPMDIFTAREVFNAGAARRDSAPDMPHAEQLAWMHVQMVAFEDCPDLMGEHPDAVEALARSIETTCADDQGETARALVVRARSLVERALRRGARVIPLRPSA
jgi:hypothetical protein